jgi:methylmalonyl-CoA mutase
MLYEHQKHTGELPIIGVNTYLSGDTRNLIPRDVELRRATDEEKHEQIDNVRDLQKRNAAKIDESLARLKKIALDGGNVFAQMMETARYASMGQITEALYEVGGQYRRNM